MTDDCVGIECDLDIARKADMRPIVEIAQKVGLPEEELMLWGEGIAKVKPSAMEGLKDRPDGKLVLVTAMTPTPHGEGKTTVTIGLGQALWRLGRKGVIAIREPSMGPLFGIKGGAAGGGYSQVIPMEDINLHFTGDLHAITSAHNLLSAMVDNQLKWKGEPRLGVNDIYWKRAIDMNDRSMRQLVNGLGGSKTGVPREDGFLITAASEIMAILALARDLGDLRERIGRILVGLDEGKKPVFARDLRAHGAMAMLMKNAVMPNLVQTLEGTPAFVHAGPFANIAHGTNSVIADRLAMKLGDVVVTEAGFGSDLGAEKFMNIVARTAGLYPSAVVLVVTLRALRHHGKGCSADDADGESLECLVKGLDNLDKHVENLREFGIPLVVAINKFAGDPDTETETLMKHCTGHLGVPCVLADVHALGGEGGVDLARALLEILDGEGEPSPPKYTYELTDPVTEKVDKVARGIYGAERAHFVEGAKRKLRRLEKLGLVDVPICIAKTAASLSDNPRRPGRPEGFTVEVKDLYLSNGAGFLVIIAGDIITMPGLPREPASVRMDIDADGTITGLF
jgi:formate--tetrahydrofolate ligase